MADSLSADITVIGAGSAGLSVAAGTAQLGLKTILIERDKMGGDCLNTGCVPSKALLAAGKKAQIIRDSGAFGVNGHEPAIDFSAVKDHVFDVIAAIEPNDSVKRFEGLGVQVIQDEARFIDADTIQVGDQKIRSRYFVVATGSRPAIPPIQGLDPTKVLTNESIFDLRIAPEHLVIIGGGPIGVEMAQAHRSLGSDVTILDMGFILPKDDPELVDVVRSALIKEGVRILENASIKNVSHMDGGVEVHLSDGSTVKGSHLLMAAGRQPNVDTLNLDKAGIDYDKGGITVDGSLRTSNPKAYALGDVAGGPQFTHIAGYHAGIFIQRAVFKNIFARVNYTALPWVTYSDPELAQVGLTEKQAHEKYGDSIKVTQWHFDENDRAQTEKKTDGLIKVVLNKKGKILGAGIAGAHAGELIGLWGLAISKGMKIGAVATMIAPYPTFGEVSKRAAGAYYTPTLFSDKTRKIVRFLQKLPL